MKRLLLFSAILISFSLTLEDFETDLREKADRYFSVYQRYKLNITLDQPKYAPGDTAKLGAAYLKAKDLSPAAGNQIVHLYLFDESGNKKLTQRFSVINGYASKQLVLPENIPSGKYLLVAFTEWMKNFDPSLFYRQSLIIVDKNLIVRPASNDTLLINVEGGTLVSGVENNIALRYSGKMDRVNAIVKEAEKEIASLSLSKDSISMYRFAPLKDKKYSIEFKESSKTFYLPESKPEGVALTFNGSDPLSLKLRLECSEGDFANKEMRLLVFNNSGLILYYPFVFSSNRKVDYTLPNNLPQGIAQLIITDSKYNLWAKRTVFLGKNKNQEISFTNLNTEYSTRDAVKFNVQLNPSEIFESAAKFSCQIRNKNLFPQENVLMDYLTFRSDISNTFELSINQVTPTVISNYLITQSCPWMDWNALISNEKPQLKFSTEQYLKLTGTATYAKTNMPVRDSTLIMFFLEKKMLGYETYAMSNGHFSFPMYLNVNSADRFFYTSSFKGDDTESLIIKIDDPDSLISFRAEPWSVNTQIVDPYFVYASQRKAINKSYSFFLNSKVRTDSIVEPNENMEHLLKGADITIKLSDYLLLPTMEEVVKELLQGIEYRKINGRNVIRLYTSNTKVKPNNHMSPLFVINGHITRDPSQFIGLNPSNVLTIKIVKDVKKLFALGKLGANGVILVRTKNPVVIKDNNKIDFQGQLPESKPEQSKTDGPSPDLRPSLLWICNQDITLGNSKEVQFTTSDDVGIYSLCVRGLSKNGQSFYREVPLHVKYSGAK